MFMRQSSYFFFFFNDTATTEIYTLSLHDALPISEVPDERHADIPEPIRIGAEEDLLERGAAERVLCERDGGIEPGDQECQFQALLDPRDRAVDGPAGGRRVERQERRAGLPRTVHGAVQRVAHATPARRAIPCRTRGWGQRTSRRLLVESHQRGEIGRAHV